MVLSQKSINLNKKNVLSLTGQMRWLALNGIVGLALMWVFNQSGMDSRWVVFSTHSVGYVLLAVVLIIMILVFGGVVLVWSHLIDFLKEILVRYPEVQEEISENKVLEQVLIRYVGHQTIIPTSHLPIYLHWFTYCMI